MRENLQPLLGAIVVALFFLVGAQQIHQSAVQKQYQHDQSIAEKQLRQVASALSQSMNLRLNLTGSLAAFVAINRDFTQQEFEHFTSRLQDHTISVRSLQLAPDGIVRYLTNIESNRVALGHNLFTDKRLQHVVEKSVRDKSFIVHGPYKLRQGGVAIVARRPLYFAKPGESKETFWGFATILVETQPILEDAGFFELEEDLLLAIRGKDGLGADGDVFYGEPSIFQSPLAVANVALPDASWQLAAIQKPDYKAGGFLFSHWYWVTALMGAILFAGFTYSIISRPRQLNRQVYLATENLRTTLESIGDAVIATDTSGDITIMNPVAEKLTGWDLDAVRGKSLADVFHLVDARTGERVSNPVSKVIAEGVAVDLEEQTILIDREGQRYPIADSASPIRDSANEITGVVLVFRDITRDIAVQVELQESEARFRNLFQNAEVSIWNEDLSEVYQALQQLRREGVKDIGHYLRENQQVAWDMAARVKVLHVNKATLKLFGVNAEDELLHQIDRTFGPNVIEVFIDSLCAIWEGKKVFRADTTYRSIDGRDIYAIVSFQIPETEDSSKSVPVSILDITEQTRNKQAIHRAQKMEAIGQLTGGIAHDFNNILGIILGNIDLLQRQVGDDEKVLKKLKTIEKTTQRAVDLTRQLLSFSRRESMQIETISINRAIASMKNLIDRSVTPEVAVEYRLANDLWLTAIDPADFEHALLNLILNARDAMVDGGRLLLQTENCSLDDDYCLRNSNVVPGEYVKLLVSDSGQGVPRDSLERIFEPFYTTKPQGKGTGLGLSLVFGFVTRSGGHIKVESELGIGTVFRLYLPRASGQALTSSQPEIESVALPRGKETLLVVDDEKELLELAKESLQALGYQVLTASDAKQALMRLTKEPSIQLLFSDVVMPGGTNGCELAEEACKRRPDLRVLLTSGYTEKMRAKGDWGRFSADLLNKPYTQAEAAWRIRALLDNG